MWLIVLLPPLDLPREVRTAALCHVFKGMVDEQVRDGRLGLGSLRFEAPLFTSRQMWVVDFSTTKKVFPSTTLFKNSIRREVRVSLIFTGPSEILNEHHRIDLGKRAPLPVLENQLAEESRKKTNVATKDPGLEVI